MLNDTKVTFSAVKAVKATGNTVKVTMYDTFVAGTTYYVVLNGSDPLTFVIAGNAAKDVESIAIISDTAVVNTAATITVALYNADGVDITESVGTGSVSLTSSNLNSYVDGLTLNMYNVGDVTDLTATFVYYDANNNYQEVKKTTTKKITAIAEASEVFAGLVYSVDGTGNQASEYYSNPKSYISLSDNGNTFAFKAYLKITKGDAKYGIVVNDANTFNGHTLFAKIPEESIALLTSDGSADADLDGVNDGLYYIQPNSVGKTNVFIGYNENGAFKTVAVAPIEVKEKRYPATLTVKPSKSNLNTTDLDNNGVKTNDDSLKLEAEVKDQFGDYIAAALKLTQNTESAKSATLDDLNYQATGTTGKYEIVVTANEITYDAGNTNKSANIVLTTTVTNQDSKAAAVGTSFSAKDNIVRNDATDALAFANSGASTLDTTVTGTTVLKAASIKAQLSSNGYFTGDIAPTWTKVVPTKTNVATTAAVTTKFEIVIKKNNDVIDPTNLGTLGNFLSKSVDGTTFTLKNFYDDGTMLNKLEKASYSFTIYKIKTGATKDATVISSKTLVVGVTDSQSYPTFTQKAEVATRSLADGADFSECFKFNFAGTNYDNVTGDYTCNDTSATSKAYFVTKCTLTVTVNVKDEINWTNNYPSRKFKLDCAINKLIKTK